MPKILLVEDDNNLREIYDARLQAEGYTIVSAHDGEEALVVAKAELPDLVISDVMMPKISGFEMLDILRNTDSLKNVKVIMLTALGQSDDQERANQLGADRYLVKSQVTLEDIVNTANELLQTSTPAATTAIAADSQAPSTAVQPAPGSTADPEPAVPAPPSVDNRGSAAEPTTTLVTPPQPEPPAGPQVIPIVTPPPDNTADQPTEAPATDAESSSQEQAAVNSQLDNFANKPAPASEPSGPSNASEYSPQPAGKKIIAPLADEVAKTDINELLAKESTREQIEVVADNVVSQQLAPAATNPINPDTPVMEDTPTPVKDAVDPNNIAL